MTHPTFVVIHIWRGKAYIPVWGQTENGPNVLIEPVLVSEIEREDLLRTLREVLSRGHPVVPALLVRGTRSRSDPLLRATGARSWKELARTGCYYSVSWTDEKIRIDRSTVDEKGRWVPDLEKVRFLPPDTALEDIVDLMMKDMETWATVTNQG
jgi:hypothetical protein